jgi:hypothetical protein
VKIRSLLSLSVLSPALLLAIDYTFVDIDYDRATNKKFPWHVTGDYRKIGKADFRTHSVKHSHVHYTDAHASAYFSHYLTPHNALSWELGYSYMDFDWKGNPRFNQTEFHNALGSLALVSNCLERWRWIFNAGVTVDAKTFDFGSSAVYYGLMWGRYAFRRNIGLHIGAFAYGGIRNSYTLPIIGADWNFASCWKLNAIFPLEFSLEYTMTPRWSTALDYSTFGGPYRFPRRVDGGHGKYHDAIFSVYSNGLEWNLNYKRDSKFWAGIGAGWNFGGWILIKNRNNRHGKYYKFDGAPYAQANLAFNF